jgi:hypothetical protein
MRSLLSILLVLLITGAALAQPGPAPRFSVRRAVWCGVLGGVSGASYGTHEAISHHWSAFERRFPGADPQFWNPADSWVNKYEGRNPSAGPAYFGSTTFLAWTTDAKHLLSTTHRVTLFGAAVTATIGERRPPWHYVVNVAASAVGYWAGFHLMYSVIIR